MARWGSICSCLYPSNDVEPPVYTVSNFEGIRALASSDSIGHGHKLSNENADESKNEDNEDSVFSLLFPCLFLCDSPSFDARRYARLCRIAFI